MATSGRTPREMFNDASCNESADSLSAFSSGYCVGFLGFASNEYNPFDADDNRRADWMRGYDAGCADATEDDCGGGDTGA